VKASGITYIEVLVSSLLLLSALLFTGRSNMTSLQLLSKSKLNQRATLLLLAKVEELRVIPIEQLMSGEAEEKRGTFLIQWRIQNHTPYFGSKQIECRVVFRPTAAVVVESLFYRSE
jgi:hypothetical protein